MDSYSLVTRIDSMLKEPIYNDQDKEWYTFILDHYNLIRKNSIPIEVSLEKKNKYLCRFKAFLRSIGIDQRADWIVMIINNFFNPDEFITRDYLLFCDATFLTKLYRQFKTSKIIKK